MSKDSNPGANNIDQIRELIFGNQMSEYEKKFSDLEKTVQTMYSDIQKSLADLKSTLAQYQNDSESARQSLKKDLMEENQRLRSHLDETARMLQKQISEVSESSAGRQQMAAYLEAVAHQLREGAEAQVVTDSNQAVEND